MKSKITVGKNHEVIMATLKKYGIAIIPSYIEGDELESLKNEYFKFLVGNAQGFKQKFKHPTNTDGIVVTVKKDLLDNKTFPVTKKIFSSSFMDEVLKSYYAPYDCKLNEDIYITHEKPCETPILPWHYDRTQALKFYIYLKDTTQNDGAFEYVPGSHNEGHYRANYHLAIGIPLQQLPNDIPEDEIINAVTIDGKAGDLIIFDPDGFHRGGVVGEGGERMVMRGHSHPYPISVSYGKPRIFSKNWWVQSPLNFAKLFQNDFKRVLGQSLESKAAKNRVDYHENLLSNKD